MVGAPRIPIVRPVRSKISCACQYQAAVSASGTTPDIQTRGSRNTRQPRACTSAVDDRRADEHGGQLEQAGNRQRRRRLPTSQRRDPVHAYSTNPMSATTRQNIIGVSGMTMRPKNTAIGEMAIRNAAARAADSRPSSASDRR